MYLRRRDFFFQAEDGIRDKLVTGVQTCALPISVISESPHEIANQNQRLPSAAAEDCFFFWGKWNQRHFRPVRSEERRVGKSVDDVGRRIIKTRNTYMCVGVTMPVCSLNFTPKQA